jgi:tetratricopeptide (TPR) repeat protein
VEDMKWYIDLNLGDVYNRLNRIDSSFKYFNQSFEIAKKLNNVDLTGTSHDGLGHVYRKLGNYEQSLVIMKMLLQTYDWRRTMKYSVKLCWGWQIYTNN